jgi:hypothetical protein
MRTRLRALRLATLVAAALSAACSSSNIKLPESCVQQGCASGQLCEVVGSGHSCVDPIVVTGRVYDLGNANASTNGIAGALVVGQDVNGAPVSPAFVTTASGGYQLSLRAPRNSDGSPASGSVTLRADAAGYASFPSGLRVALPVALTSASHAGGRWTVQSSLTDVGLVGLSSPPAGRIQGTVQNVPAGGALVVAECGAGTAFTAVPGADGSYVIFNVPAGTCTVSAYAKGVNYGRATGVTVPASATPVPVDLARSATAAATVRGSVNFVAGTDWNYTSVLLVLDATYAASTQRGLSPPGLKAAHVPNGPWSIDGIPDGHYRVLAAFENDYLVRDPSEIGGTAVHEFQVVGGVPLLPDGTSAATLSQFKITGAVRLLAPFPDPGGACTTLASLPADPAALPLEPCDSPTSTPTFAWEVYPSTDHYELTVLDAVGIPVWKADVDGNAGSVVYGATSGAVLATTLTAQPLTPGMYQLRLVAIHTGGNTISASEDLLGVFAIAP